MSNPRYSKQPKATITPRHRSKHAGVHNIGLDVAREPMPKGLDGKPADPSLPGAPQLVHGTKPKPWSVKAKNRAAEKRARKARRNNR